VHGGDSAGGTPAEDRLAVVLGASGGIGTALTTALARQGWSVVTHHRSNPAPDDGVAALAADLTDWEATRALATDVVDRFGPPELVVNCAGRRDDGLLGAQSPDRWMQVLVDNVAAAYHPVRAFVPSMARARRGSIVQVTSVAGLVASPGQSAYGAAKAAIMAMTRTLAAEYGSRGLRFNSVAPGFIETAMTNDVRPEVRAAIEERQAVAGTVSVADVVNVITMLADTPGITGQVLRVDQGLLI
jgi:3-oxoacyl-[acyl-carrier protein] reductase